MIQIIDKSQCTGCTACQQVCAHDAIRMQFDAEGHSYPIVNASKCVDCGLCEKVCPMLHKEKVPLDTDLEKLTVRAVYNKDEEVRKKSTSGGVFSLMAEYMITQGGVVYAARFDEKYHILHSSFDSLADVDVFRGSKYAQSDLGNTFRQIRQELKNKPVLFVGTPCQVAGLKSFLIKEYPNLYTCDFICMGISSPVIWEEYLKDYWDGHQIKEIFFKDKRNGWHQWQMNVKYDDKEYLVPGMADPFFNSYLTHLTYRPSCFECPFRTCRRVSDFTIADCWGIDKINPEFDDNKGCTTIILQSKKAEDVFSKLSSRLKIMEYDINNVMEYNPYIVSPIPQNERREKFYTCYKKKGFTEASIKFCRLKKDNLFQRIIYKIKHL